MDKISLCPNEGLPFLASYLLGILPFPAGAWQLMLFKNAVNPTELTVYADLVECDFTGYARVTLTPSSWVTPVVVVDRAETHWGSVPVLWTSTAPPTNTIFGYALVDPVLLVIMMIEQFSTCDQFTINPTAQFSLVPNYTLVSKLCP